MTSVAVPMEIEPEEFHLWMTHPDQHPHELIDVREPWEHDHVHLSGDRLLPMNEVPQRLAEIPTDADVVVYCHHGVRSFQVVYYLRQHGYSRVRSLSGGIARWGSEIDPSLPQY